MMARIVQFALRQRAFVLIAAAILAGAGWYAFRNLPIDAFPDILGTQVKILLKSPGMTPEEMESRVTAPVEVEMLGIPRQRMLRSVSKYGVVDVTVDFEDGTDIYWARQQVNERLSTIQNDLPRGVTGGLAPITTPLGEMVMFTIEAPALSLEERRTLLDWVIRPALRTVPGVADVNSLGGRVRAFEIVPDATRLGQMGISTEALRAAIQENNRNDGAGRLSEGGEVMVVRGEGSVSTLNDLREVVVARRSGVPVRLGEIAEVREGSITRNGAVSKDGKAEAVKGMVLALAGSNARRVVEGVERKLAEIGPTLPPGVKVEVFYNRASLVDKAVGTVSKALLEATVLVLILLGAFLGNLRAAITVAAVLPLSALSTFIAMRVTGMSANLMSLGGLAIALGMLVDAAVVVVENVVQHLGHSGDQKKPPLREVVAHAVHEVATPVCSGVLIIVTVFLPLLTLQGLEGKLFAPVALTIVYALAGSLSLSLTVVPVIATFLLKHEAHGEPWLVRKLTKLYHPLLTAAMKRQRLVFASALVVLGLAVMLYTQVGKTFMPTLDEGDLIVGVEKLPTINLEDSVALDMKIQQALMREIPEIARIVARVGADEIGMDPMGLNQTDTYLILHPRDKWQVPDKTALEEKIRNVLRTLPGFKFNFTQPIDMRVSEMVIGVRGDLAIKLFGSDLTTLNTLSRQIEAAVREIPGAQDVFRVESDGMQYMRVVIDRLAAGNWGLSVEQVQEALRVQLEGTRVGTANEGVRRIPILLRGPEAVRLSPEEFSTLRITTADGRSVPLRELARLERTVGPIKVDREMGSRYSVVVANVGGRDLVGFVEDAKAKVNQVVPLPQGYRISWGGQFENQQRAAARLTLVVPIALALIFLILFSTFGSVRQALLVLSNIPFALVGGVAGLWLAQEYLSVPASVGFIALLGIAVLNGVVLVSYFNQLQANGLSPYEAVMHGALRRLRPVLMTAAITAFGLIPLLFATGPGSEIQRPLAIVVIGGLITSTALTLILLPLLYLRFGHGRTSVVPLEVRNG